MAEPRQGMDKADFVTSLVLLIFGILVVTWSIQMPRLEHRGINPYTIPGLVPGLLGVAFIILSVMLLTRSVIHKGYALTISREKIRKTLAIPQVRRVTLTLLVCLSYALGLIGRLWYPAATFLFVLAFIVLFEYQPRETVTSADASRHHRRHRSLRDGGGRLGGLSVSLPCTVALGADVMTFDGLQMLFLGIAEFYDAPHPL